MRRVIHLVLLASMLVTAALPALTQVRAQNGGDAIEAIETPQGAESVVDMAAVDWYEGTWLLTQERGPGGATLAALSIPQQAELLDDWSNAAALACITPLGITHNAALGAGLAAVPPADFQPAMVEYAANLALKYCAPAVFPAPDFSVPGAYDADLGECGYAFAQERTEGEYKNFYGLTLPWGDVFPGKEWGEFDQPAVVHFNTDVEVTVDNEQWARVIDFTAGDDAEPSANYYWLPAGVHNMQWRGDTQISPLDYLPKYVPGIFWTKLGKLVKLRAVVQAGLEQALERGIDFASTFLDQPQFATGMYNEEIQRVAVRDTAAPHLTGSSTASVEAVEPGGVSRHTYLSLLRRTLSATDNCDAAPQIIVENESSLPAFAAVGSSYTVNWVAEDRGPKDLSGARNRSAPLQQTFTVRDTLPPIVLAPPDIVRETASLPAAIELGHAATFDLADLNPTVSHNACALAGVVCSAGQIHFPAGARTVTWTATDHVGLTATATQLVNVKAPGSNHGPTAQGQSGGNAVEAVSYEPVTITLQAEDADGDPLWFNIEDQPDDGYFHAPLYPYFIQDYRLANVQNIDFSDYCEDPDHRQQYVPTNWPIDADFMAVADSGTVFVRDEGKVYCTDDGDVDIDYRLAIFRADGTWDQAGSSFDVKDVYVDWREGFIYQTQHNVGSTFDWFRKYDLELNLIESVRMDYADEPINSPKQALMDGQGIIYVTNGQQYQGAAQLYLYKTVVDSPSAGFLEPRFLADYSLPGVVWQDLALDSAGNLYASSYQSGDLQKVNHRIYKFSPATLDEAGNFTPGALIGWLGKCDSGSNCDEANGRSFGYSCTDATCFVDGNSVASGAGPGQFDFPWGIALDNNDILYVTDYYNERVQRFTPEGYFAGQAVSECDGSCFVLGDFGRPQQVSVNSSHFYVLDDDTDLLHVFETTPLTRIDGQTAQIVYQSDNNFVGTDSFTFRATDGLDSSAPATVQLDVARNFRPPVAIGPLTAVVAEDAAVALAVEGYDPDGALDTLVFEAVDQPLNGTFARNGGQYLYTPGANFEGVETFSYAASDGVYLSEPQAVTVTVSPVNDVPSFPADDDGVPQGFAFRPSGDFYSFSRLAPLGTDEEPLQAGRGFKTVLTVNFYDPDVGDVNFARVDWGDGVVQNEAPMSEDGSLNGPALGEGQQGGYGTVTAEHVFAENGTYTVQVCVRDNALVDANGYKSLTAQSTTGCKEIAVQVSPMTDMLLDIEPSSNPMPLGGSMSYAVTLTNNPPQSGAGLRATGIVLSDTLDSRVQFEGVTTNLGTCAEADGVITCNIGALDVGATATVEVAVSLSPGLAKGDVLLNQAMYRLNEPDQASTQGNLQMTTLVAPGDFVVNTVQDAPDANVGDGVCATFEGYCSLQAAVAQANATPGRQTISLADWQFNLSAPLEVWDDVDIAGLDAAATVLVGMGENRLISVPGGASLTLSDVGLQAGYTEQQGGAVYNAGGEVTLTRVQVSGNFAQNGGGGLWNGGSLTMVDSAVTGNTATYGAGGIANTGGLILRNVTVSGNRGQSGGIESTGTATLNSATVVSNEATGSGGGLNGGPANFTLRNTILALNTAMNAGANCGYGFTSQGYNLLGDMSNCTVSKQQGNDVVGEPAALAPSALNGAGTLSHAPRGISGAIDAGVCDEATDQRGVARPVDGDLDYVVACDIGAVEFEPGSMWLPVVSGG